MEFRDLKTQYKTYKKEIDEAIQKVIDGTSFISGSEVNELEAELAEYVGVKHCITCANGTDALTLAMMALDIGEGDAVFVPDFTFFSSGEIVAFEGATPIFVDIDERTFNISADSLVLAIDKIMEEGVLTPKAIIPVDLFGQPADYDKLIPIAKKYGLKIIEDGAQGFGGQIRDKKACSFGDISTTSFFPAKPLGCYGDGGAIFTDNDEWAELIKSYRVHGKGTDKYDNVRIGMNSRLDTIQAAILRVKLKAFVDSELNAINYIADIYSKELGNVVSIPLVKEGYLSSWAQYSILVNNSEQRDELQKYLREQGIPSMIYYKKPMHKQEAFDKLECTRTSLCVTEDTCKRVLSIPIHPYLLCEEQHNIINAIKNYTIGEIKK